MPPQESEDSFGSTAISFPVSIRKRNIFVCHSCCHTHICVCQLYSPQKPSAQRPLPWGGRGRCLRPDACPSGNREDQGPGSKRAPREALTNQYCLKSRERQEYVGEIRTQLPLAVNFLQDELTSMLPSKTSGHSPS